MKRRIQGLSETASNGQPTTYPTACSSSASTAPSIAGIQQKPFYILRLTVLEPRELAGRVDLRAALLHRQGPVEARLVPARFPLRSRTARDARKSMRKPSPDSAAW